MSLFKKLKDDRITAMKAKNVVEKNVLSYVVGQIQIKEKAGNEITDSLVMKELKKLIKSNIDSENAEVISENQYLERYIPKMLTNDEITVKVKKILDEKNVTGTNVRMIGVAMAYFNKNYAGQFEGKTVTAIVRQEMLKRD